MNLGAWTLPFLAAVVAAYWVLVIAGWSWLVTRPATQARARARHFAEAVRDPDSGTVVMTYRASLDLSRIIAAIVGPPLLLVVAWILVRTP